MESSQTNRPFAVPNTSDSPDLGVGAALLVAGLTVATAESCTGGNVAARFVAVSGSSAYFLGGIVSYANDAKRDLLGVPPETLERYGAVSTETALAMAYGARRALGTDLAVSTTGIAGPGGGTDAKSVGLVYIALVAEGAERCHRYVWNGDRATNIRHSTEAALRLIGDYLKERR